MAPIRVALIGLSCSGKSVVSWASIAHLPYLLSARGQSKFKLVALLNSSVDAAQKSIAHFKLPSDTKAYGSPDDLAADPDVDLVVCCTRVDTHADLVRPSVAAGKSVYVEWPLARTPKEAEELVELARKSGSKTVVGLQGRVSPLTGKVKELLEEGKIGKVLSSQVQAYVGVTSMGMPAGFGYFFDRKVGGNLFTIEFGHAIDMVEYLLGEPTGTTAHFQLQHPTMNLFNPVDPMSPVPAVKSDVPDLIVVTGTLPSSSYVADNATLQLRLDHGQPFPGDPLHTWTIVGEKGQIRCVSTGAQTLQMLVGEKPPTIQLYEYPAMPGPPGTKVEAEDVEWKWEAWQEEVPVTARNIGSLYEAFAEGAGYPTFEDAVKRQGQLDDMWKDWKA
ncbi:NAD(P)-binding domain protein [Rhypophila decipiens]|uniref:NAD(P)-binding domain protein n=1 Tax=Rhypophila decipiens TaxID=261697 RepID=A0AAN6YG86_9PEZI|nr:NAD(P)-binding domain protein [Rhypophila decipiens]